MKRRDLEVEKKWRSKKDCGIKCHDGVASAFLQQLWSLYAWIHHWEVTGIRLNLCTVMKWIIWRISLSGMGWKVGRTGRIRQAADRSLFMCRSRIWKSRWRISANEYCMHKGDNVGRFTSSKGGNHAISRLEFYKKGMIRFRIMPFVVWETTIEGKRQATFREKRYGSSPGDFAISVDLTFLSYREEYPMPVDSAQYSFRNRYKP